MRNSTATAKVHARARRFTVDCRASWRRDAEPHDNEGASRAPGRVHQARGADSLGLAAAGASLRGDAAFAQPARVIRTLAGDLNPAALSGSVLFHEHVSMRFPLGASEHFTDDVELMIAEARAARGDGVACLVDGGHADMGRNLEALRRITAESGLPIVASGGYYMQRSFPPSLAAQSADELADALAAEALRERYGAFGEIGQQGGVMTADERKVFQAVAKVQARTGLPIFTHNAYLGTRPGADAIPRDTALRQLDVLEEAGAGARTSPSATSAAWTTRGPRWPLPWRGAGPMSASIASPFS